MLLRPLLPRAIARSGAVLVGVLTVGSIALPAAHATDVSVSLVLGPSQSGSIGRLVSNTSVTPVPTCDPELSVSFDADLNGTVLVGPSADAGAYTCTIDFQLAGQSIGLVENVSVSVPGLSVGDVSVAEGDAGTGSAVFTVTMSQASTQPVTVAMTTGTGTASDPADYQGVTGTVTFPAGATSETVAVPVVGDTVDEPDETFTVDLGTATGAAVTRGQATGTIVDDDRNGAFSCRASAVNVGGLEPLVANGPGTPCQDDATLVHVDTYLGEIHVVVQDLLVSTDQTPDSLQTSTPAAGDQAVSVTDVSEVTFSTSTDVVTLDVMSSQAMATCVSTPSGLVPSFSASSGIFGLVVNGTPIEVGADTQDIAVPFGVLHLNATITTSTSITQRAVWLQTLFGDVIAAESGAGVTGTAAHPSGNPCVA